MTVDCIGPTIYGMTLALSSLGTKLGLVRCLAVLSVTMDDCGGNTSRLSCEIVGEEVKDSY